MLIMNLNDMVCFFLLVGLFWLEKLVIWMVIRLLMIRVLGGLGVMLKWVFGFFGFLMVII